MNNAISNAEPSPESRRDSHRALVQHLSSTLGITPARAHRAVEEMLAYFDETPERFVIRRHRELQEDGVKNIQAFAQIRAELDNTRFVAPPLSERQVRRLIYG